MSRSTSATLSVPPNSNAVSVLSKRKLSDSPERLPHSGSSTSKNLQLTPVPARSRRRPLGRVERHGHKKCGPSRPKSKTKAQVSIFTQCYILIFTGANSQIYYPQYELIVSSIKEIALQLADRLRDSQALKDVDKILQLCSE